MSVQTEIDRIITAVGAAYDAVEAKGGTLPASETVANLAEAISSIPKETHQGSASETWVLNNELEFAPSFSGAVKFTSFGTEFWGLTCTGPIAYWNDIDGQEATDVFYDDAWVSPQYRKLIFDEAPTGELLQWLQFVGVKQPANLAVQPSKDVTITSNGTTEITPDAPYDVMEKANVTVNVPTGGGTTAVSPKDINFYDYDGTCVAAWSLAELAGKTALPDYPTHDGLTCQGWNWTLADLKAENAKMNVGAMYITSDGKTRIYITLQEGRKSPMLGICPKGTVTVDWGDGTTPNTLTGTSVTTVKWTPTHNYAAPGDYVITLTVNGTLGFDGAYGGGKLLCYSSSSDNRNKAYLNAIQRVFLGSGVTSIRDYAFQYCASLAQITLPSGVTSIGDCAFQYCYSLAQITLPSGVTSINADAFYNCYGMAFYDFTACTAVPTLSNKNAFNGIPADCEIRVPAALADEWKAATNWATYANQIVGV